MYECISVPSTEKHDKCSANSTTGVYKFCPDIITHHHVTYVYTLALPHWSKLFNNIHA